MKTKKISDLMLSRCRNLILLVTVSLLSLSQQGLGANAQISDFEDRTINSNMPCRLFVPTGHDVPGNAGSFPLILFLHGNGERQSAGFNTAQLSGAGAPPLILANDDNRVDYPAFILAPQLNNTGDWGWGSRQAWVKDYIENVLIPEFPGIDTDRIYVTGLSLGGGGTYTSLRLYPDFFAAGVPMSGPGALTDVATYVDIPIWHMHGANDAPGTYNWTSVSKPDSLIPAIREEGGRPIYTRYPNFGHHGWSTMYSEDSLLPWMFSQVRGQAQDHALFAIDVSVYEDQFTTSSATITLTGTASTDFRDDSVVRVEWYNTANGSASAPNTASGTTSWTASNITLEEGLNRIVINAYGDQEVSWSRTLFITHDPNDSGGPTNQAPTVDAGADQILSYPVTSTDLEGIGNDDGLPSGSTLTTSWTQLSGPVGVTFNNMHDPETEATFPQVGEYTLRLTVSDGEITVQDEVSISVLPESSEAWISEDIGNPSLVGSASSSGTSLTVQGSGRISSWHTTDQFHFVHQQVAGDFTLIAQVTVLSSTAWHGKAMAMARTSLDAGADNFFEAVNFNTDKADCFYRDGGGSYATSSDGTNVVPPHWIRIDRVGHTMTGYHSTDGTNWTQQTSVTMSNLPASMVVGLGVTSDSTSNMATATFDHYDITVPNEPPTVNAGMDQTTSLPTATVTLAGNATDDNPASLTTTWSQLSGPGTTIFSDASSLTSDATFDTAGVYVLELSAGDGQFTDTDTMEVTVAEAQVAQWSGGDIGTVAVPGGFSTDEQAGTFTVSGSGEIKWWNFTDGCYFVSQQVTGDFTLTARVLSMSTNTWHGKAMVMARESHGSGSINFFESVGYSGGIRNYLRDETNGQYTTDQGPTGGAPYWVRIERSGNTLISSYSADGVAWTIHTSQTLSIGSSMEVGLAVTCDSGSSTGLTTATFDNVTLD